MTKINKKNDLIKEIITQTRSEGTEVFDLLTDKTEKYLAKLLNVIKGL